MRRRFPYLAPDVVNARFRQGDGWLEPRRLALELARASGARFDTGVTATGFIQEGDRVRGVTTTAGSVRADWVVVAAGPLSGPVAKLAGLDLPLSTVRRHKLIIPDVPQVPGDAPMTIEFETGAHWRPAGGGAHALWTAPAPAEPPLDEVPTSSAFAFGLLDPRSDHALARIVPQKLTQVHALRSMSVVRTALLRSAGLAATAAGMRTLLARSPEPERAGEQWQTLTRLAVEAQRVNALNIRLAHTQERHVDQAMATLSHAAGRDVTYGADGRSQHHAPSRSLAAI